MAAAFKTSYTMNETRDVKGAEDAHRRLLDYCEQEGYEPSKVVCSCHQHHDLKIQIVVGSAIVAKGHDIRAVEK
jgi:hypothetical protein